MRLFNYGDMSKNETLKRALGYDKEPTQVMEINDSFGEFTKMLVGEDEGSDEELSDTGNMNIEQMFSPNVAKEKPEIKIKV
jgi:hypothetical protein